MAPAQKVEGEGGHMEPIAIVGMGMRFPGESHSSEQFWDLLQSGRDGWRTMPKNRCELPACQSCHRQTTDYPHSS